MFVSHDVHRIAVNGVREGFELIIVTSLKQFDGLARKTYNGCKLSHANITIRQIYVNSCIEECLKIVPFP